MNFLFSIILIIFITSSCSGIKFFIGKKEIHEERDEAGVLITRTKVKKRSTRLIHHPHNPAIIKTKIWNYNNGNLIGYSMEKRKRSMTNWDGKILKSKNRKY